MLSFFYRSKTKEPYKFRIAGLVVGLHLFFLLFLFFFSSSPAKSPKKHLVVKTVMPPPSKPGIKAVKTTPPVAKATPPTSIPKKETQKKEVLEKKKPEAAKPAVQKPAPAPVKKTVPAKNAPKAVPKKEVPVPAKKILAAQKKTEPKQAAVSQDLLQELEESIAKIDQKRDKIGPRKKLDTPKSIETLSIDTATDLSASDFNYDSSARSGQYQDALIQLLHENLHLPDFGEVKLQLTLAQDGKVLKVVVLNTESEKNKSYLELNLPKMRFPKLEEPFSKKSQHTFVLTFCNEI